jgi:hypothetical protein
MHDTINGCGCGCGSGCACGTLPAEFVRVRYYFGQRLGVMELSDQFFYHAGKMAFHNLRLHGFGVLCGLRAEKQKPAAGTLSTVLRVTRGAALDPCGREIVVAVDQCIDVAAWFAKNRARPALAGWTAGTTQTLRLAIRFRECPTDPSPAPRDPCGCDNNGCEFGRVREGFELGLFATTETVCAGDGVPAPAAVLAVLEGVAAGDSDVAIKKGIDTLMATGCPAPTDDLWLCLADFQVRLDVNTVPDDISDPDNTIPERRTLLPTHALQTIVLGLAADGVSSGSLSAGPRVGALTFTPDAASPLTAGSLAVPVLLVSKGSPPAKVPLAAATFDPASMKVSLLDAGAWKDVTPTAAAIKYDAPAETIRIDFTQDLEAAKPFLLAFEPSASQPTVDDDGRPLPRFTRRFKFRLDTAGTALELDPVV